MKKLAKAMMIPVRQRTQYTCVPCSLMMCLKALGMDWLDEDTVNDVMGARPMKGATWEQVIATAQHFGKRATLTAPCTIEQMREWTDQGLPIMIAWNPEGRDWSHASAVFHVCDEYVWVADPNIPDPSEVVRKVPHKDFYSKWYEKFPNYLVRRPAVVISHEISDSGVQVPYPNMRVASSDYMSKQNIRDSLRMCQDLVQWIDGEGMEDWVEDKLSVIRAALSDVHRFYINGKWDIGKEKVTLWREASVSRTLDHYYQSGAIMEKRLPSSVRVASRYNLTRQDELDIADMENTQRLRQLPKGKHVVLIDGFVSEALEESYELNTGKAFKESWQEGQRHDPVLVGLVQQMGKKAGSGVRVVELKSNKYIIVSSDRGERVVTDKDRGWKKAKGRKIVLNSRFGGFGLSVSAKARYTALTGNASFWEEDLDRTDPMLVRVVDQLGSKANGSYSSLVVKDLPSSVYYIHEYDGAERLFTNKDFITV